MRVERAETSQITKSVVVKKSGRDGRVVIMAVAIGLAVAAVVITASATVAVAAITSDRNGQAAVAVAVAIHGQSDGHGPDHSLAVISRPGHQP